MYQTIILNNQNKKHLIYLSNIWGVKITDIENLVIKEIENFFSLSVDQQIFKENELLTKWIAEENNKETLL